MPSVELVEKVRTLYNYNNNFNDVRILIPIILHIPKKEIISALPKFLKLNPQLLKDVFARLLGVKTDGPKSNFQPSKIIFFNSMKKIIIQIIFSHPY